MIDARVASLHLHPIKGCRPVGLARADVAVTGLRSAGAGDREWMVVDATGRFLTQREHPRLALVIVDIVEGGLRLQAPGMPPCDVTPADDGIAREVVVWRSDVLGVDQGDAAAQWFSQWLGCDARLVRFGARRRECNRAYAGDSGAHTMFADGYPVLVASAASLADLNARLATRGAGPLPMDRFRPNVVIDGLAAFDEDHIDTISIGDVTLRLVKPCTRCQVTTIAQDTAEVGVEPLPTLGEFRMDPRLDGVTFGMNAIVVEGAGQPVEAGAPAVVTYRF
ncbi:MAG: MOSC N-terminal beta barrel domain-containing protein [Burkholderiales bacterium]